MSARIYASYQESFTSSLIREKNQVK